MRDSWGAAAAGPWCGDGLASLGADKGFLSKTGRRAGVLLAVRAGYPGQWTHVAKDGGEGASSHIAGRCWPYAPVSACCSAGFPAMASSLRGPKLLLHHLRSEAAATAHHIVASGVQDVEGRAKRKGDEPAAKRVAVAPELRSVSKGNASSTSIHVIFELNVFKFRGEKCRASWALKEANLTPGRHILSLSLPSVSGVRCSAMSANTLCLCCRSARPLLLEPSGSLFKDGISRVIYTHSSLKEAPLWMVLQQIPSGCQWCDIQDPIQDVAFQLL